jgi:hypothetical protein
VCTVRGDCADIGGAPEGIGMCRINLVDGRAVDTRVLDNRIEGSPAGVGISTQSQLNPQIRGNVLRGLAVAVEVVGTSLEIAEITRNRIEAGTALVLSAADAQRFGARISLNDVSATTPVEAGGGTGTCVLGVRRPCVTASECDVDACNVDGRCHLNSTLRCNTDADCTAVNKCVTFSHAAELSVGHCTLDASLSCSTDSDCSVGACAGEPTRPCRTDRECRRADGRSPSAGLCTGLTSRGTCTGQRGNHWGRSCADSEGFRDADEPNPDSRSPLVTDSHPYGVPVAGTPDAELPSTCR